MTVAPLHHKEHVLKRLLPVNPTLKPGSTGHMKPHTYRRATLVSVLYSVYCDIRNRRLPEWMEESNIIADVQNGFRQARGYQEHLYTLYGIINNRTNSKLSTYANFMTYKKLLILLNGDILGYKKRKLVSMVKCTKQ